MRSSHKLIAAAAACAALALSAVPAAAKCTRLGFSVNDYGKDGPTKDAKELLDKHIAKWAAEHKIAKYTTGKKDVNCELFLNFIVFDEHTCRAEATVCWDEKAPGALPVEDAAATVKPEGKKKAPAVKAATVPAVRTPAAKPPLEAKAESPRRLETGAIPARAPEPASTPAASAEEQNADKAAEAAAAAAKAAAAAERAAAAAERAAAAVAERTKAAAAAAPAPAAAPVAAPAAPAEIKQAPKAAPIAPVAPPAAQ